MASRAKKMRAGEREGEVEDLGTHSSAATNRDPEHSSEVEATNEDVFAESASQDSPKASTSAIKKKTKTKSKFNEFYDLAENNLSATCRLCLTKRKKTVILQMPQRTTTGLKKHLQRFHINEFNATYPTAATARDPQQQEIVSFFNKNKTQPPGLTSQSRDEFNDATVDWLARKYLPFSFFDDDATQMFFTSLNDQNIYPKRNAMRALVLKRFSKLKEAVKKVLEAKAWNISFTVDGWTSIAGKCFYGITAHFIDEDWILQSIVLDFIPAKGKHAGKDIAELFKNALTEYGITSKIQGITLDNASVNTTFVEELSKLLPTFDSVDRHFRCFGHIINLAVQDLMKGLSLIKAQAGAGDEEEVETGVEHEVEFNDDVQDDDSSNSDSSSDDHEENMNLLDRLRGLFKKIKKSEQFRIKFDGACRTAGIPPKAVVLDVPTRWNSSYAMIKRALEVKPSLDILCDSQIGLKKYRLREEDWSLLSSVKGFLKNCKKVADALGGETYTTLPDVVTFTNLLLDYLTKKNEEIKTEDQTSVMLKNAYTAAYNKITKHYNKTNWVYCVTMVLDPRHKLDTFDRSPWGKELKKETFNKFQIFYKKYADKYSSIISMEGTSSPPASGSTTSEDDLKVDALFGEESPRDEVTTYFSEAKASRKTNILVWWKQNEKSYPILAEMARDFLSTPATSVPAERLFSSAGLTIRKQRSRLTEESATAILCIQSWTKEIAFLEKLKPYL